ncbi:MAG: dephospho-CoA kinase [Lentimicrobiaceae bacterium]
MLKIGLTGSIGSGKTTIARVFSLLNIPVYLSDYEAKKILDQPEVTSLIVEKTGNSILSDNGLINRKALAEIVFNDIEKLQWLNSLIHPRVRQNFFDWAEDHKEYPYIIQESAILFESGFDKFFNKIIVVTCPKEERISRVLKRDTMTRKEILDRMDNQWAEELKIRKADIIIHNDEMSLAIPQVIACHNNFLNLSGKQS